MTAQPKPTAPRGGKKHWVAVLDRSSRPVMLGVTDDTGRLESGDMTFALSGQLYDVPSGESDLERVRVLYERHGAGFADRLNGVFAAAAYDRAADTLYVVRDPLGVHPVFFSVGTQATVLADSPEAMILGQGVAPTLNRAALADHICHRWPDPTETYYENIRRLPPGHVLTVGPHGTSMRRYWNPAPPDRAVQWIEDEELDRFDALIDQAVGRALDLGRAGIFLSGGLDSVSVAAVAADRSRRQGVPDPLALSLAFPDADSNEEVVQRGVAESLGLEQVMLPFQQAVGDQGLLSAALEVSQGWPAPLFNIWYPAYKTLTAAGAERGAEVIVTGAGGDEWLGVSPFLAADHMRHLDIRGMRDLWKMMHRSYRLTRLASLKSVLWRFGAKPILADLAERTTPRVLGAYRYRESRTGTPDWVAPDLDLRSTVLGRAATTAYAPRRAGSFYLREGQISLDHALVSMEMEEVFEGSRRSGLDVRMPYWDPDLVDFLYRTPPAALTEGGLSKGLVRKMLSRRFPQLGFERHKKVLATNYFTGLIIREGPEVWRKMGGAKALSRAGVIEPDRLHSWIREVFEGARPSETARVWNLLSLEVWVRGHERGGGG